MLFNSLEFLFFFPIVCFLYFLTPWRYRWVPLLIASYYFYMSWNVSYIFLILITTLTNYFGGIQIEKHKKKTKKKQYLLFCIFSNLFILFLFKYFNFFNSSFGSLVNYFDVPYNSLSINVLLPVGISFYTFQSLSYSIDVYYGRKKAEKHLGIFALYVAFFPQLVAGPIERSGKLLPQFFKRFEFDSSRITDGLRLMGWGFFKKLVIADRMALLVDQIYNNPSNYTGIPLILATYFFSFQIYCDFSAYSDIAIGAARVLGIKLSINFNYPYFAKNISDFWRRWHITLMSWFRDYIYIPLGGNRVNWQRWCFNILIVFLVSGLWHGANWTFVIWGGLHGTFILISRYLGNCDNKFLSFISVSRYPTLSNVFKIVVTFHLVTFLWIFFRANTVSDAFLIVSNLFNFHNTSNILWKIMYDSQAYLGLNLYELFIGLSVVSFLVFTEFINYKFNALKIVLNKPVALRWSFYYAIVFMITILGVFSIKQFIYFQF